MRRPVVLEDLSRRVPTIVTVSLCAALVLYWIEVPLWLPYGLAMVLGGLALILMARRHPRPGPGAEGGWLAQELAGHGSPSGTYVLGFAAVIMIALTGFEDAYAFPGWAALALTVTWAVANARYPVEDEGER